MCETLRDANRRVIGIVCGGHRSRKRCRFCNAGYADKLCDFPVGANTCDAGMCNRCATSVGEDRDYCPKHKDAKLPAVRGEFPPPRSRAEEAL